MSRYFRPLAGSTYFFTIVAHQRRPIFCNPAIRSSLAQAIQCVRDTRPFVVDAWVLLPDHMHCIWTLPEGDVDYATRWLVLKRYVSLDVGRRLQESAFMDPSEHHRREANLWQRQFWEHQIRDDSDFDRHMDYVHFDPVKHRHVERVRDWPHSTFHRHVREGTYAMDWNGSAELARMCID
ncbi:REP-associated tyrosine transposase [Massilia niabensis]|uniref:Transposase n=1 Tax=Massilia niabensis TaxID=544910 RepID=A0ABW0L113_9BURK